MSSMMPIDYALIAGYALAVFGLGIWCARGQRSPQDFFLAGRRIGGLSLGISLMATLASSMGFIAVPTAALRSGLIMLWSLVAFPIVYPIVTGVFMPFYQRLHVYTAYEYLERRFDLRVRLLTSGLFIAWRVTWMAAMLYVPAMALRTASGGAIPVAASVAVLGALAVIYTMLGGMKAVIWTDAAQFVIMFGGVGAALFAAAHHAPEGMGGLWQTVAEAGKTWVAADIAGWEQAGLFEKIRLYIYTDFTVGAIITGFTVGKLGNYCVDQVMIQRYLSARSVRAAQWGFLWNSLAFCLFFALMTWVGLMLGGLRLHGVLPDGLPPDAVFPYFIAHFMPAGLSGLMLAALVAAAMSSLDSGLNACAAAVSNDFHNRLALRRMNLDQPGDDGEAPAGKLGIARGSSLVLGAAVTVLACYVGRMGDVFQIALEVVNSFIGPLLAIFALAMFSRRAQASGVFWGGIVGSLITALVVFGGKLSTWLAAMPGSTAAWLSEIAGWFDVGFLWTSTAGLLATLALAYGLSLLQRVQSQDGLDWTYRAVTARGDHVHETR